MRRDVLKLLALSCLAPWHATWAQEPPSPPLEGTREPKSRVRTTITVELVTSPTTALEAQRWGAVFQRQNVEVRTRSAAEARPEIRERKQGPLRSVTIVAVLEGNGSISVPGRRFTPDREQAIADWLIELKTYGAQGRPEGKPSYGLSKEQFDDLFHLLEQPVLKSSDKLPFDEALAAVSVPRGLSMRLLADASEQIRQLPKNWKMSGELKGLSRGTALAILMAQAGLAFRPGRTPDGDLELVVVLLDQPGVWPVGWPLDRPPLKVTPKLVDIVPIEVDDQPLPAVFARAARESELPVLVDELRISAKGVDLTETKFTQLPKRTMWSIVLVNATSPHHLLREVLVDEAGLPFVWITTNDPKRQNERAKQREILQDRKAAK